MDESSCMGGVVVYQKYELNMKLERKSCLKVVSKLSQSCLKVVSKLTQLVMFCDIVTE